MFVQQTTEPEVCNWSFIHEIDCRNNNSKISIDIKLPCMNDEREQSVERPLDFTKVEIIRWTNDQATRKPII